MLTYYKVYDNLIHVDTEEYPSLAEGVGLENREASKGARGFESLLLRHHSNVHEPQRIKWRLFIEQFVTYRNEFLFYTTKERMSQNGRDILIFSTSGTVRSCIQSLRQSVQ